MDSSPTLDKDQIQHCLNFHGQQLQKIWDSERGDGDLSKLDVECDFSVYQERQKNLNFQDRGKRLKIQHFIARQADQLFDVGNLSSQTPFQPGKPLPSDEEDFYAVLPPYDTFLPLDKPSRIQHFYRCAQPGDLLICSITTKSSSGMMLKVLCTDSIPFRFIADLNIKAFCPASQMPPGGVVVDKKGVSRAVMHNEAIRVELLEVVPDSEKMVVSMLQSRPATGDGGEDESTTKLSSLGLVYTEDLPTAYKKCQDAKGENYSNLLEQSLGFANPSNTELLASKIGIANDVNSSFFKTIRGRFSIDEYAQELRQVQASKWAFKSVADGITLFKSNRHSEAFQCLNRALSIDRRNVEGLVARGALFANSGSYPKAIEDFENALKLNPNHQNARKYMGETLVALGRSHEDQNDFEEAMKCYEKCLALVPFHEEAQCSIRYLENKMRSGNGTTVASGTKLSQDPQAVNPTSTDDLIPGGLTAKSGLEMKATLKQLLKAEQEEKGSSRNKKKKERKRKSRHSRKRRRRDHSSSSSSSSSTASASSSSSSSSSSGSGSSADRGSSRSGSASPRRSSKHRKNKKHVKESHREKSLSPLSKRMALMESSHDSDGLTGLSGLMTTGRMAHYGSSTVPYSFEDSATLIKSAGIGIPSNKEAEYEQRVRAFLEQTKGDSEYEDKVRKFLEETAKWKKERKGQEKDSKKKKKKEKTKSKDKEKGKKKKSKEEEKRRKRRSRKSGQSDLGEGPGSARTEQFEEEGNRQTVTQAMLKEALGKQLTVLSKLRHGASESSSDEQEDTGSGMVFSSLKKQSKDKSADISRMLGDIPDLDDLESKLKSYYAKIEKDKTLSKKTEDKDKKPISRTLVTYPSPIGKHGKSSSNIVAHASPKAQYHPMDIDDDDEKQMDIFADSPSPPSKSKMGLGENSNIVSSKWKMQITPTNSKVKKREVSEKEPWEEIEEKRVVMYNYKEGREEGEASSGGEAEPISSRRRSSKRGGDDGAHAKESSPGNKNEVYYEKFGGFRIARKDDPTKMDPSSILPAKAPPTPVPAPSKDNAKGLRADSDSEFDPKKRPGRKSRSRSKSSSSHSRARSSGSSASEKRRRSRSRSYRPRSRSGSYRYGSRSRSRSYDSRSRSRSRSRSYDRSRSRSYYSRSRSGSREGGRRRSSDYFKRGSRSPDRYRRYDNQRNMNRYPRQRGTYYRPRFQTYNKNQRGGYGHRGGRGFGNRGGRPFVHRGRGRGRPRYFHYNQNRSGGYRPDRSDHHRRYSNSRERSRNSEDRRSYEERDRDRDAPERERDRDRDRGERSRRDEDRRSAEPPRKREREGGSDNEPIEEADFTNNKPEPSSTDYIDRKMFEGKWAEDRDEEKRRSEGARRSEEDYLPPPPGTDMDHDKLEDTDNFLDKVKGPKKDDLKGKNKPFVKSAQQYPPFP